MTDKLPITLQPGQIKAVGPIRVLGIDLGTTNCTVAELNLNHGESFQDLEPELLDIQQPTLEGTQYSNILVPSVVALYQGQMYIGEGAKRLRAKCGDAQAKLVYERSIFWEDKNFMGVAKTMHKAPKGFQSAPEIAGHILKYLREAAENESDFPVNKTVVTVPACFQTAQRQDTLRACELAGLDIAPGDLLDEPVAAFIYFLFSKKEMDLGEPGQSIHCLIFDFGGGTCDVAIFHIRLPRSGHSLHIAPKAVSRYHKLGGGDIDKAIVHEILIPQLMVQYGLSEFDLDFETKKYALEPALLSTAEMLKIGLCRQIDRYEQLNTLEDHDPERIVKSYPGRIECPIPDCSKYYLDTPSLSASQFTELIKPFLDTDIPYHKENEYRWTCSVFVPLQDALVRAGLEEQDINLCLMVGASARIPNLRWALNQHFHKANVQALSENEIQSAVASGACLHAFLLQAFGQSVVQPCCAGDISIQTQSGPQVIIPANTTLPFPEQNEWSEHRTLTVPETSFTDPIIIRVELQDDQGQILEHWPWEIEPPINEGEQILLHCWMDTNQTLYMELSLPEKPEQDIRRLQIENPVTSVVNPNSKRQEILELEEAIRTNQVSAHKQGQTTEKIADLYRDIGQREKAVSLYRRMLQIQGPNAYMLNKIGLLYGEIGDYQREEKYYLEAEAYAQGWKGPLFNLALSYRHQGRYVEAASVLDRVLQTERNGPYLVLRAIIAEAIQDWEGKTALLEEALHLFAPLSSLSEWELHWYSVAVRMQGLEDLQEQARQEVQKRKPDKAGDAEEGILPGIISQPVRR